MKAAKSSPMTAPRSFSVLTRAFALVAVVLVFTTCNKVKPTKAIITVVDADSHGVAGAYVKLFANPTYPLGASRTYGSGNASVGQTSRHRVHVPQ